MLLEIGVAVAVVASVAVTAGSAPAKNSPATAAPTARTWTVRALPVLTALVDDLSAVDSSVRDGGAVPGTLGTTRSNFLEDLARAHALGPPEESLATRWSGVLGQVDVVAGALAVNGAGADDGQLRTETEAAAEALVSFVGSMEHP